jgi:hypothetical protein
MAEQDERGRITFALRQGEHKGKIEGKIEGKIAAILAFLAARGVAVGDEVRARIEACKDAAVLDRWIVRAATAASAEEIFSAHD